MSVDYERDGDTGEATLACGRCVSCAAPGVEAADDERMATFFREHRDCRLGPDDIPPPIAPAPAGPPRGELVQLLGSAVVVGQRLEALERRGWRILAGPVEMVSGSWEMRLVPPMKRLP